MSVDNDLVGLTRTHRWMRTGQAKALRDAGCSHVIDLDDHKLSDVLRLARGGRVFVLVYAFLLLPPKRTVPAYERALEQIEAKGGAVKDLHTGLVSSDEPRKTAFKAVVRDQIARDRQGAKAGAIGRANRGRQHRVFTAQQIRDAKAIWRDRIEYPTWDATNDALKQIKTEKGEPFTRARAHRLWGARESKR